MGLENITASLRTYLYNFTKRRGLMLYDVLYQIDDMSWDLGFGIGGGLMIWTGGNSGFGGERGGKEGKKGGKGRKVGSKEGL